MRTHGLGLSLLVGVLAFMGWVLVAGLSGGTGVSGGREDLAPPASRASAEHVPLRLSAPPRQPSPIERLHRAPAPGPAQVLGTERGAGGDRLVVEGPTGRRLYAAGELLPDGRVVVGFVGEDEVRLFDGSVILQGRKDGEAWSTAEDFALPPPVLIEQPPLSEELQAAVLDTFDAILIDPASAQLAVDALLDAGEVIVPVLAHRLGGRAPCVAQFVLPDGRVVAPADEGALVLVLLEALTGRRFGDPLTEDPIEREELEATWAAVLD